MKINKKMFIYFSMLAVILIMLFFTTTKYIFSKSFENYKINTVNQEDEEYVNLVREIYKENEGDIDKEDIAIIGSNLRERIALRFLDAEGHIVWEISMGPGNNMPMGPGNNMPMGYGQGRGQRDNLNYNSYNIISNQEDYGILEIGRYGRFNLSQEDIKFQEDLNQGIIIITLIAAIITVGISLYLAKEISKPILKIKDAAARIRDKKENWVIKEKISTYELNELANTINSLGKELETQEALRLRLTSDVSHELRTPLNVIQNQIEGLQDGVIKMDNKSLEEIRQEVFRLTNLVKDLEKLTDITNYQIELKKKNVKLNDLLKDEIFKFKNSYSKKEIKVDFLNKSKKDIYADIDKDKFKQILLNLFSNADKYSKEKLYIRIEVEEYENYIYIKVIDKGIGIPEESKDFIFERFYREEKSRNRKTGGAGLGLSIVKTIVEAHGGNIYLNIKNHEETEFIIKLPK